MALFLHKTPSNAILKNKSLFTIARLIQYTRFVKMDDMFQCLLLDQLTLNKPPST